VWGGLQVEFVMSFHKCGGNVGDNVHIPLPRWVLAAAGRLGRDRVFYTDRSGGSNDEYISGAADENVRASLLWAEGGVGWGGGAGGNGLDGRRVNRWMIGMDRYRDGQGV
jgi:hypothetical protein